jgi:ankyrin repeat protein
MGNTALMLATMENATTIVESLIEGGADLNVRGEVNSLSIVLYPANHGSIRCLPLRGG